jgi:glycerophosphoryl diester phosphodiesterase
MLEKPTRPDVTSALAIYKFDFDFKTWQYQGQDQILHWLYPVEEEGNAIGELTAVNENQFLVIERDGAQGPEAETKKVFLITLGEGTQVEKELLVDLLEIDNPQGLGGFEPGNFRFPFTTIEAVEIIDEQTLILCNDNNFPFSTGRGPGVAEDTEFIVVRLPEPLDWTPPNF